MKPRFMWLTVSLLFVFFVGCGYWYWVINQQPEILSVKEIATSDERPTLDFYPHIAQIERPQETFQFPIAIGQIGPTTNLYSGPNQYPFYCMTSNSGLGQPEVDNQLGLGVPVVAKPSGKIIGYSKDCSAKTRLSYFKITPQNQIIAVDKHTALTTSGTLLRVEQGTINRFIYTLIMPISTEEIGDRKAKSRWNKRLIYQFNGGSGIGFRQGRQKAKRVIDRQIEQLKLGYAVISSSGNKTSYTYNMLLAEDTARRVKKQFTSLYGEPLYTVGIGGSGGGLAQYLIAQNSQGILDGLIPLYSYPDMITQTTYALDCDLLNNYFTFRANDRKAWRDWTRRRHIEGMNAINDFPQRAGFLQPLNQLMSGFVPSFPDGNSECINGYFGLSAFINNPRQGFLRAFFEDDVVDRTNWSYWQDMANVFGTDEQGLGLSTWDNQGVQYGLEALKAQQITLEEFIDINKNIGAWKPQAQMQQEEIALPFGHNMPIWLTLWGNHNITTPDEHGVAPRHQGSLQAMENAYRSGQVFIGKVNLPIIDARHYLENELDMHHMSASFYTRLRIAAANSTPSNQVIWVAHQLFNPTELAFEKMDEWLLNLKKNPSLSVADAKPATLFDTCFDEQGNVIASGDSVFNGIWNNQPQGTCTARYPMFSTSRIQAGASWAGDTFKCARISIEQAIAKGIYAGVDITPAIPALRQIYPDGVCDYSQPDVGRPPDLY
ncbi:DUF6351 family protein [Pseudoalteromonas piscicida]|uniref:DUF6351 domain-containing protein n=1 Tax=Pseudoalteromonas piscicida TaxID=43662 RepID=A0A2A5JTI9_PSEO7|nr:DUF6351 family protein [Pseudoalteromonas piscicida]PCK32792.1 hypothetical protein CEX98_05185 [Pseudoalteromonas piscicida]